jgi:hypothetical protein
VSALLRNCLAAAGENATFTGPRCNLIPRKKKLIAQSTFLIAPRENLIAPRKNLIAPKLEISAELETTLSR